MRRSPEPTTIATAIYSVAFACLLTLVGGPAVALKQTNEAIDFDPRPGANMTLEPSRVTIAFDRTIPSSKATIVVRDSSGKDVTNGVFSVEANNIYANLPYPLAPGVYTVHYRVQDDNKAPFGGSFQFGWKMPNAQIKGHTSWRGTASIPPVVALEGDPSPSPSASEPTEANPDLDDEQVSPRPDSTDNSTPSEETQSSASWLSVVGWLALGCLVGALAWFALAWRRKRARSKGSAH